MALKSASPFPIFPPTLAAPPSCRPTTEIRFSRWNNANAQPFLRRQREQHEIEDDLRRHRRFESASRIAEICESTTTETAPKFKSHGTPSSPSTPSIPGKKSKYSKPPQNPTINPNDPRNPSKSASSHPAFQRIVRLPREQSKVSIEAGGEGEVGIVVGEHGISYKIANAPFEFQYSYTETPKVKPLAMREPPYLPFGPSTMPRPWTGRAPLPASKKKLPAFDSFKPPPPGKKGVKPVQAPGPFLSGSGPQYKAKSREEILGEPLTEEEVKELIKGCLKTTRQLNMGRDGLTHNMLDNIHAHWKRRRVCKIKCKGVCTVDMDNVYQRLEEKTGGKIIYRRGGVLFLFRGRNYNFRTRPRFPLMLWKPSTPVYPRLVQHVPEGLTLEEATEMRKKGRKLQPICKLGKNGVYSNLVKDVKEAFEECELVRINCQGMNKSDCRKIGAKLQDLVPCILLSFEYEHILMWRGKGWRSSLTLPEDNCNETAQRIINGSPAASLNSDDSVLMGHQEASELSAGKSMNKDIDMPCESIAAMGDYSSEPVEPTANGSVAPSLNSVAQVHLSHLEASELSAGKSLHENIESPCETMAATEDYSNETTELTTDGSPATSLNSAGQLLVSHQKTKDSGEIETLNGDNCFVMPCASDLTKEDLRTEESEDLSCKERNGQVSQEDPYASAGGMHGNLPSLASTVHQKKTDPVTEKSSNDDQEMSSEGNPQTKSVSSEVTEECLCPVNSDLLLADSQLIPSGMGMSLTIPVNLESIGELAIIQPEESFPCGKSMSSDSTCLEGVTRLLKQAIENGSALVLEDGSWDANVVYKKSVSLAKRAPPGPIFRQRIRKVTRKVAVKKVERQKGLKLEPREFEGDESVTLFEKGESENKSFRNQKITDFREGFHDIVPQGSLRVDELAKLLS